MSGKLSPVQLNSEDRLWLIWALGFVAGAKREREKTEGIERAELIESKCLELAVKLSDEI